MLVLYCFLVSGFTAIAISAIVMKLSPTTESEVLRAAYRRLETEVRSAQEAAALVQHNIGELRERLGDQRDADRARLARCEVQVEGNERAMVKLASQFKDAITDVKQEGSKLSMLVGQTQRTKGF